MSNTKTLLLDLLSQYNNKIRPDESGEQVTRLMQLIETFEEKIRLAIALENGIDGLSGEQTELLSKSKNEPTIH